MSKEDKVLLSRLWSGHNLHLETYRARTGLGNDPTCPHCVGEHEDLEHWFQPYQAIMALRQAVFGDASPPLSVLCTDPRGVLAYSGRLGLLPPLGGGAQHL